MKTLCGWELSTTNDWDDENTEMCCGEPMNETGSSSEYWGAVQDHIEYTCQICGAFFID